MTNQTTSQTNIAVLTSGGDAPGMNPAVRAVIRTALNLGNKVYAIYEGYEGMVKGEDYIKPMRWHDAGGIIHLGGTIIGSARSNAFRTREGRRQAAKNLIQRGIDRLIVIGGDGSLTGANLFRQEWSELLAELVSNEEISPENARQHPELTLVGLVGSIDNDMFGTDMTIGADTALHRIVEAIDAIESTAASHQRTFVVEVMGRHCGYLALMSAIATGANWVFIPERPPESDDWGAEMCQALKAGREIGRRQNIVIVAEGAHDRFGNPITAQQIKAVLDERLGEDTRITILGHVQRGGSPSAFDRFLSTVLGHAAVEEVLKPETAAEPKLIGLKHHTVIRSPLMACVEKTRQVAQEVADQQFDKAMALRGGSFTEAYQNFQLLARAYIDKPPADTNPIRIAIMHAGGLAPGMNTAVRVAVRIGLEMGHTMLGIKNGFEGLAQGEIIEMDWKSVRGWVSRGGSELGTNRTPISGKEADIARQLAKHKIDALLIIGGWVAYQSAYQLYRHRDRQPALTIPIICLPATIDNNLPGTYHSIGADTALNSIVADVDKIKQSAVAANRCFVVEVMGRDCGYLAMMSGLATGAERVYLPEEGISLNNLQTDVNELINSFKQGKRLGLVIRNEYADEFYTSHFIATLFEKEGGNLFDVRQAILGHLQQGGNPSPFDRIQATRLAAQSLQFLVDEAQRGMAPCAAIGLKGGKVQFTNLENFPQLIESNHQRPKNQWWAEQLQPIAQLMSVEKREP